MVGIVDTLLDAIHGDERWETPREELSRIERLGNGQFGEVSKMVTKHYTGDYMFVAVKSLVAIEPEDGVEEAIDIQQQEDDFVAEVELMKRLRHPNVVSMLGCCLEEKPFLMVLELLVGGSLDFWLPENGPDVPMASLVSIAYQTVLGLGALKDLQIVHRDLAARNLLIGEDLIVKIADFGLSRDVATDKESVPPP